MKASLIIYEINSRNGSNVVEDNIISSIMNDTYDLNIYLPPGYENNSSPQYKSVYIADGDKYLRNMDASAILGYYFIIIKLSL